MAWELSFISEEDFTKHVKATIDKYGEKLESYDIIRFNKNIIDPVKIIFDKTVYRSSWEEIVSNEIFRQRDKANNNDIGYFHQRIFQYMPDCHVPENGMEGGWDVILKRDEGVEIPEGDVVHNIYVEMKNKHNTMNSAAAGKTYIKMQSQLLEDDDCACLLVEAIAKKSQNIKWSTTVDGKNVSHRKIRRVSIDKFYELVTGQKDAFFQICMALPEVIEKVVSGGGDEVRIPHDVVLDELRIVADRTGVADKNLAMSIAFYLLGFSSYCGFAEKAKRVAGEKNDGNLRKIYEIARNTISQ